MHNRFRHLLYEENTCIPIHSESAYKNSCQSKEKFFFYFRAANKLSITLVLSPKDTPSQSVTFLMIESSLDVVSVSSIL